MADLADMIRQMSYYQAGGKDEGMRDIDKVNSIFGTVSSGADAYLGTIRSVLKNKQAELENKKLQRELNTGERPTQPLKVLFGSANAPGMTAGTPGLDGQITQTQPKQSAVPESLKPFENLTLDEASKATNAAYLAQRPDLTMAGLQDKQNARAATEKRFQENLGLRKREYELNRAMRTDRMNATVIDKFNADPDVKKADGAMEAAATIKELAISGNAIAAAAIPTYMARMSGEVGNLSEADKAPFGGSRAILARMEASFTQMSTGTLTPENQRFLVEFANLIEKRSNETLDRQSQKISQQYGQLGSYGNQQKVQSLIRPTAGASTPPPEKKTGGVLSIDANGNKAYVYPDGTFEEVQ